MILFRTKSIHSLDLIPDFIISRFLKTNILMFEWNCVFLFDRVSISATIYLASSPWASPPTKPYCAIHQESLSLCLCRHGNRRAWLPLTFWPSVRQRFRLTQRHPEVASSTSKRRTSSHSWIKYLTRYNLKLYVGLLIYWCLHKWICHEIMSDNDLNSSFIWIYFSLQINFIWDDNLLRGSLNKKMWFKCNFFSRNWTF